MLACQMRAYAMLAAADAMFIYIRHAVLCHQMEAIGRQRSRPRVSKAVERATCYFTDGFANVATSDDPKPFFLTRKPILTLESESAWLICPKEVFFIA